MADVLIIDDEYYVGRVLSEWVRRAGHQATAVQTLVEGFEALGSKDFDVVFLDVYLPDGNGLEALPEIRSARSAPEVIIVTGAGNQDGAELAIKSGAWDYVEKSYASEDLVLSLTRALQYRAEKRSTRPPMALKRGNIIGSGPKMLACFDRLAQAAGGEAAVLIVGETGTGKELFALAIHENSRRAEGSFVVVDCAAIPASLVESLLFGYAKGAFTGADRAKDGLIKQADHGTLFLDEVGELPLSLQKPFLRVLQEHRFRRLGDREEQESNFRLVAATNQNLERLIEEGRFRPDLFFRLRSLTVEVPPLRERPEDIKDLALHYISRFCERDGRETKGFTPDFLEMLVRYDWPGNVRDLINALEEAIVSAGDSPTLFPRHLPERIRIAAARSSVKGHQPTEKTESPAKRAPTLRTWLKAETNRLERKYLFDLMIQTKGDVEAACRLSGLSRTALYNRLKKHRLSRSVWLTLEAPPDF